MEKVILITGATSDVGVKLIENLNTQFDKIICHYCCNKNVLEELRKKYGDKIVPIQSDFSDRTSVEQFAMRVTGDYKITHIVHLAAPKYSVGKFSKTDKAFYEENMQIQFYSILEIVQKCIKNMVKQNYGRIVFMLSSCTEGMAPKYLAPYVSTKYALKGLMKSLAAEYVEKNISVNGISPGMMRTKFLSEASDMLVDMQEQRSSKGKLTDIESVVTAMKLLLADEAEFITGKNLVIDGEA